MNHPSAGPKATVRTARIGAADDGQARPQFARRRRRIAAAAVMALSGFALTLPGPAQAAWPERPIHFIVAYAAGGGTDLVARLLVPHVERYLGGGARFTVNNRPGAGGAIGFSELARAAPDGYTIGMINTPNVLTVPIERKADFSWRAYDLIGNVVDDPGNFAVRTDNPVKSLAELAAAAKARPGAFSVGTTGVGSDDHLAMLMFERAAGVKMTHVPFKGSAEVRTAIQGGHIEVAAINIGEALQYVKGGSPLRSLGTMSVERSPLSPDLATFREQGFDIVMASLRGVAAPKGLPPDIRQQLVVAFAKAIADPKFRQEAEAAFAPLRYLPPDAYAQELADGEAGFRKLWNEAPWAARP